MRYFTFAIGVLLMTALLHAGNAGTVTYDSQCLTIDGHDVLIFSGAFHYFRCPKELWPDRFRKIKEAGFNTVETYVAWNYHERRMPKDVNDFSQVDLSELAEWMKMAHEQFGLWTIIRPGPYICAEWAGGGYPAWLLTKRPADYPADKGWLRSDDPVYLAWSKHWYDAVCKVVAPEQVTRKPAGSKGVILFQIENEYDFYGDAVTEQQRVNHLKALHRDAKAGGIDVPIFTCWTRQCRASKEPELKDVFDGPNFYPRWDMNSVITRLTDVRKQQPNAPVMIPECQGGWFSQVGGVMSEDQHGIDGPQIHHLTLLALALDARIINYYMLFGGTNFGDWTARGDTTSYDYNSPIREWGGVGERYEAVKAIGKFLQSHGDELVRATEVKADVSGAEKGVEIRVLRAPKKDGPIFFFCRNTTATAKTGKATVKLDARTISLPIELESHGFKVLYLPVDSTKIDYMPKPIPPIDRPPDAAPVRIKSASRVTAKIPRASGRWTDVKTNDTLAQRGLYDSEFVVYQTIVTLSDEQLKQFDALWLDLYRQDNVVLNVNGQLVFPRGTHHGQPMFPLPAGALRAGENTIVALYENLGWGNFGRANLEANAGLRQGMLTSASLMGRALEQWRSKLLDAGDDGMKLIGDDVADGDWPSFTLDEAMVARFGQAIQPGSQTPQDEAARVLFGKRRVAVFRSSMDITDADQKAGRTRLNFDRIDDRGRVFVNGTEVGQSKSWDRPAAFDISKAMKIGKNTIAVIVDNSGGGDGGILAPVHLEGEQLDGLLVPWGLGNAFDIPETGWETVELDTQREIPRKSNIDTTPSVTPDSMFSWYRMEFELPKTPKDQWIPWHVVIDASGNGFLAINGHELGRYWEVGPQREFYLPECWLKFGPGEKNTLTLRLRSTPRGSQVRAVEVGPYAGQAERR